MVNRVKEAAELIKAGNKAEGKNILVKVLTEDEHNEAAWLWMSAVVDTHDLRRECLEKVLTINPNNQTAKNALTRLPKAAEPTNTPVSDTNRVYTPPAYNHSTYHEETPADDTYMSSASVGSSNPNRQAREIPQVPFGEEIEFKFQLYAGQHGTHLFTKKGYATPKGLELEDDFISYDEIVDTAVREKRLVVVLRTNQTFSKKLTGALNANNGEAFVMEVGKIDAADLKKHLDKICSRRKAEEHRQQLIQEGKGNQFRFEVCPNCHAIVDLSDFEETRYIFCRYCDSLFNQHSKLITDGAVYQVCDQCGLFDRVRGYWEVFFYFLIVMYGYSYKRIYVCDNCAHKVFVKTFLKNFLFILGVPFSIYMKLKSMSDREPHMRVMAKANKLALKGEVQEAMEMYLELEKVFPEHPGLLMNQGVAYMMGGDSNGAIGKFKRALIVCSNYHPVIRLVYQLQNAKRQ
jgi:DNA-directed RNA polymerase subunit RPC12/RpoP